MRTRTYRAIQSAIAVSVSLGLGTAAHATIFNEVEPNDNKTQATPVMNMVAGDMIVGNTQGLSTTVAGPTSADYFLVSFPATVPGIYRNRLQLSSNTLLQTGTIRGLTVSGANAPPDTMPGIPWDGVIATANAGTDAAVQTSSTGSTPPRFNTFYTFGRPAQMYYRVHGNASSTADYAATLETVPVVPTPIGVYQPGLITLDSFNQGHTNDLEVWVYDSNLQPIPGYANDGADAALGGAPTTGFNPFWLARDYTPGTYYVAVSGFNLANDIGSPSDDNFRTGSVMDFADVLAGGGSAANANMTFTISDGVNTLQVPNTRLDHFDVNWFVFTVVPEPGTLGLLAIGLPALLRRRRY